MVRSDSYKLLAQALASEGISAVRIDKRGFYSSAAAAIDPNDVTLAGYAEDLIAWAKVLGTDRCVWLAGHSEGGLVALVAAQMGARICGLILLSAPGRPIGDLMREQFAKNPANRHYLNELNDLVDILEAGETRDISQISPALRGFFSEGAQRFMVGVMSYDPVQVSAALELPVLIVQGKADIQVTTEDSGLLAQAMPHAQTTMFDNMTHMLKADVPGNPSATYGDPSLPIMPGLAEAIAKFISVKR